MTTARYNPDIQILRGVAILAVYAFHLRPNSLPSGYLGVDVFFVVSGYLMYTLYGGVGGQSAGAFLFRRARRILPAYFAVLIATTVAVAFIALPHELAEYVRHAIYSLALIPNFGFWMDNSYFDRTSLKPLLHLWSLGVELQFYLIFPIVVWLHRKFWPAAAALALLSFAACIVIVTVSPKTSFFLTPMRLWQFMIGFYAASALMSGRAAGVLRNRPALGLGCLGVIAVCSALGLGTFQHPRESALAVSLATAGVIVFGLPALLSGSPAGRALVRLGDYSYSIYLVHFPVIILWFYRPFKGNDFPDAPLDDVLAVTATTAVLALALYHSVEMPARRLALRTYLVPQAALVAAAAVVVLAVLPVKRSLFNQQHLTILDAWLDRDIYRCGKLARLRDPFALSCSLTPDSPSGASGFLLVGNSHADAIKTTMAEVAASRRKRLRLIVENCPLAIGSCAVAVLAHEARLRSMQTIVLHAAPGTMRAEDIRALVRTGAEQGFAVALIHSAPVWPVNVMQALYEAAATKLQPLPRQTAADYRAANAAFLSATAAIKAPNFTEYFVQDLICTPSCQLLDGGKPLYFDSNHLTLTGAERLRPVFEAVFDARPR